ncbi:glycerophosphodiester phosphodiesterase [uncultured Eudoraea sp.]|uniref:glycerophosphodiester phosphodiesterase n=1 Tax=uncultured Eudoraea sp. TaxID=1035614 RepID=UPI002622CBB6|nr:glycerophosphodiester phosphodiesterase [uncultured Eudoraea sp.]
MKRLLIAVLILSAMNCKEKSNTLITIGHRGAMGHETENTLSSVQKALDLGVDMIEIDVFKISSGEIVVFHDDKVDLLTDGSGAIESMDLKAVKDLNVKGDHKIPLLTEVLDLINKKVRLNIELKGSGTAAGVMDIVNSYIENAGWTLDDFVISSFKWEELTAIRNLNRDIEIAVLTDGDPLNALAFGKEISAVAINPHYLRLNKANVLKIKSEGFKIFTWTVNDSEEISRIRALGVDGIFTDYPERIQ